MKNSEIKSFAKIKFFRDGKISSEQINFFDKIYFQEKNNSNGGIEIKKKEGDFGNIKFPTNAENSCFLAAKEMQKFFAKKNNGKKPRSISITIEKNIPLNSGLGGANSNGFSTLNFLNNFWEINLSEEKVFEIGEKIFSCHCEEGNDVAIQSSDTEKEKNSNLGKNNLSLDKNGNIALNCVEFMPGTGTALAMTSGKKFFILIPKYISVEKNFFQSICHPREGGDLCCVENFSEAQKKIKEIFPDLEKFIKIFLENGAEFSDISGKGGAVFGIFDEKISEEKIKNLEKIFENFGELKIF